MNQTSDPYSLFQQRSLSTGLTVYCLTEPRPFAVMEFIVHAGSREDTQGKEGLAHYVEHLVSENIPGHPSHSENREFFNSSGGYANFGGTSLLKTSYDFKLPLESLEQGLDIFGAMLTQARLTSRLNEERLIIVREYQKRFPTKTVRDIFFFGQEDFFPSHRTTHSTPLGTLDSLAAIENGDFQPFYDRYYVPQNIDIVCAGGISDDELVRVLERSPFGQAKDGARNDASVVTEIAQKLVDFEKTMRFSDFMKEPVDQSAVKKIVALPEDSSSSAMQCALAMIGDELDQEIRQKRALAYQTKAKCHHGEGPKYAVLEAAVPPDKAERVSGIMTECVTKLLNSEAEFEKEKKTALNGIKMSDATLGRIVGNAANDLVYEGKIQTMAEEAARIEALPWTEVKSLLEGMLDPARNATLLLVP